MGKIERIQVPPEDRERLVRLVKDRNTPQKIVWRSQIVLLAGEGIGAVEVATRVGKSVLTVRRWRRRYAAKGVDGLLKDATRPPGRKPLTARKIKQVVNLTLNEKPPDATHWSERTMAARAGIAPSSVHKIWAAHGLKPHLTKTLASLAGANATGARCSVRNVLILATSSSPLTLIPGRFSLPLALRGMPKIEYIVSRAIGTTRLQTQATALRVTRPEAFNPRRRGAARCQTLRSHAILSVKGRIPRGSRSYRTGRVPSPK